MFFERMMKLVAILLAVVIVISGCGKKEEPTKPSEEAAAVQEKTTAPEVGDAVKAEVKETVTETAKLVPLPLVLPKPQFQGTPQNIKGVDKLDKPLGEMRAPFMAPEGVKNVALNKPVIHLDDEFPIMGELEMITDGDKEASDDSLIELGPFKQGIQIDLEDEYEIYAVVIWHFHKAARVYFDVAVQVSDNAEFKEATTIFNNDHDNSLELGVGEDNHYVETNEGRLIDAKGISGRYVRLFSNANNQNDLSHYVEVAVYGKKAE